MRVHAVDEVERGAATAVDAHLEAAVSSVEFTASSLIEALPQVVMLTRNGAAAQRAALLAGVGATTESVASAPTLPGRGRRALESHAIRTALVSAVQECATRLSVGAALPRLLETGDRLRAVGELEAAASLCYGPARLAFRDDSAAAAGVASGLAADAEPTSFVVRVGAAAGDDVWQSIVRTATDDAGSTTAPARRRRPSLLGRKPGARRPSLSASNIALVDEDEGADSEEAKMTSFSETTTAASKRAPAALALEMGNAIVVADASDEQLALYARARYGEAMCRFGIAVRHDPHFMHPCTVAAANTAMGAVQRTMGAVLELPTARCEALYWVLVNGSVHLHSMATPLARCGFGQHAVSFLSWAVVALEQVVNICSSRFLRWRLELYRSLAGAFLLIGDTRRAAAAAARAAQQVDSLWACEALQVPVPNETLRTLRQSGVATRRLRFVTRLRLQPVAAGAAAAGEGDAEAAEAAAVARLLAVVRAYRDEPLLQLELISDALEAAPAGVAADPACRSSGSSSPVSSGARAAWGITGEKSLTDVVIDSSPLEREMSARILDENGGYADERAALRDVNRLLACVVAVVEDGLSAAGEDPYAALLRVVDQYERDLKVKRASTASPPSRGITTPHGGHSGTPGSPGGSPRSQQQIHQEAVLNAALARGSNALTTLVVAARVYVRLLSSAVQFHHSAAAKVLAPAALTFARRLKQWHDLEPIVPVLRTATAPGADVVLTSARSSISSSPAGSPRGTPRSPGRPSLAVRTSSAGSEDFEGQQNMARDIKLANGLLNLDDGVVDSEGEKGRDGSDAEGGEGILAKVDISAQLDVDGSAARAALPSVAHRAAAARSCLSTLEEKLEEISEAMAKLDAAIAAAAEEGKLGEKKKNLTHTMETTTAAIEVVQAEHDSLTAMLSMTSAEAKLIENKARLLQAMDGLGASLRAATLRRRITALKALGEADSTKPSDEAMAAMEAELVALAEIAQDVPVVGVPRISRLPCKWLETASEVVLHLCNGGANAVQDAGTAIAVATAELGGMLAACACRMWRPYCDALVRCVECLTSSQTAQIVASASAANSKGVPLEKEVGAPYLVGLLQRCLTAVHVAANGHASPAASVIDDPVLAATVALRLGRLFAADGLNGGDASAELGRESTLAAPMRGGQANHANATIVEGGIGSGARPEYRMAIQTMRVGLRRLCESRSMRLSFDAHAPKTEAGIAALARSAVTALPVLKAELDEEEGVVAAGSSPTHGSSPTRGAAAVRPSRGDASFGRGSKLDPIDGSLACLHVELERALMRAELRQSRIMRMDVELARERRGEELLKKKRELNELMGATKATKSKAAKEGEMGVTKAKTKKAMTAHRGGKGKVQNLALSQHSGGHDPVAVCEKRLAKSCGANHMLRAILHIERALLAAGGEEGDDGDGAEAQLKACVKLLSKAQNESRILYGAAPSMPSVPLSGQAAAAQRTIREQRVASAVETALKEKKRRRFRRHAKSVSLVAPPPPAFLSRSSSTITLRVEYPTWAAARACVLMSTQEAASIDGAKVQLQTAEAPVVRLALFGKELAARDYQGIAAGGGRGSEEGGGAGAAVVAATLEDEKEQRTLALLSSSVSEAGGLTGASKLNAVGSVADFTVTQQVTAVTRNKDSHNIAVNAQNVLLAGTGVPLVLEGIREGKTTAVSVVVTIHGLQPNKQYIFATAVVADLTTMKVSEDVLSSHQIAASSKSALHLLSPIGVATPVITTQLPLPVMALWGHLACAADRCGPICGPQLHIATEALDRHFVQKRSSLPRGVQTVLSPADELAIRQSRLLATPPAVLRLFHSAMVMLVDARDDELLAAAEGDDSDSEDDDEQRAFTSLLASQRVLMDCVGQVLVALQVAVALEDAQLVANTATRAYVLMLPLLRLRNTGRWMLRPLTILFSAVHRVCSPVTGEAAIAADGSAPFALLGGAYGVKNVISATKSGFDVDHGAVQRIMVRTAGVLVRLYTRCDELAALAALLPAIRTWCDITAVETLESAAAGGATATAAVGLGPSAIENGFEVSAESAESERSALWSELMSIGAGGDAGQSSTAASAAAAAAEESTTEGSEESALPLVAAAIEAGATSAVAVDALAPLLWTALRENPKAAMTAIDRATAVADSVRQRWLDARAKLSLTLLKEMESTMKGIGITAAKATTAAGAASGAKEKEGDDAADVEGEDAAELFDADPSTWTAAQQTAADTATALAKAEEERKMDAKLLNMVGPEPKGARISWRLRWLCRIGAAVSDSTATFDDAQPALMLAAASRAGAAGATLQLRSECRSWIELERMRYSEDGFSSAIGDTGVTVSNASTSRPTTAASDAAPTPAAAAQGGDGEGEEGGAIASINPSDLEADREAMLSSDVGCLIERLESVSSAVLAAEDRDAWMTRINTFDPLAFARATPRFENDPLVGHFIPHGTNTAAAQRAEGGLAALREGRMYPSLAGKEELVWLAQLELLTGVATAREVFELSQQQYFVAPVLSASAKARSSDPNASAFKIVLPVAAKENEGVVVGPEMPLEWMPPTGASGGMSVASCLSALSLNVRSSLAMVGVDNLDKPKTGEDGEEGGEERAANGETTDFESAAQDLRSKCAELTTTTEDAGEEIALRLCLALDRLSRAAWRACWGEGWGVLCASVAQMWNALTRVGALPMLANSLNEDSKHFWRPLLRASHTVVDMLDARAREHRRSEELATEMDDGAFGISGGGDVFIDIAHGEGEEDDHDIDEMQDAGGDPFEDSLFGGYETAAAGGIYSDAQHLQQLLELGDGALIPEARAGGSNEALVAEVSHAMGGPELLPGLVRFVRFTMQALLCAEEWAIAVKLGSRMLSQCHRSGRTEELVLPLLAVAQRNVCAAAESAKGAGQATVRRHDNKRPPSPKLSRRLRMAQAKQLVKVAKKLTPEQQVWKNERDVLTDTLELLEVEVARQNEVAAVFDGMCEDAKRDKSVALAAVHETLALCRAAHLGGADTKLKTIEAATNLRKTINLLRSKQESGLLAEMLYEQGSFELLRRRIALAGTAWTDGIDAVLETFDVISKWRTLDIFDDDSGAIGWGTKCITKLGLHRCLLGGIMLVKIAALCEGGSGLHTQAKEYVDAKSSAVKSHDARAAAANRKEEERENKENEASGSDDEEDEFSGSQSGSSGSESDSEGEDGSGHHHHHHHHHHKDHDGKIGKQVKLAHARECCLLAARLFSAVWGSSLPHPPPHRPHLFGEYWAEELWPTEQAVDPLEAPSGRQFPPELLLGSLAFCARRLIQEQQATLAMPLIALQEHIAWVQCRDISATVTARILRCRALTSVGRVQAAVRVLALLISTFKTDSRPIALPLASGVAMDVETSLSFNSGVRGGESRWTIEPPPLVLYPGTPTYDDCMIPSHAKSGNAATVQLLCDAGWMTITQEGGGDSGSVDGGGGSSSADGFGAMGDAASPIADGAAAGFSQALHGFSTDSSDALRIHAFSHRNERSVDIGRSITLRRVELMVRIASANASPKRDLSTGVVKGETGNSDGPDANVEWTDEVLSTREQLLDSARSMLVTMLRQLHDDVFTLRCSALSESDELDGDGADDEADDESVAAVSATAREGEGGDTAQAKRKRKRARASANAAKAKQHAEYMSPLSIERDAKILKLRGEQCACLFMLARVALSQTRCTEAATTAQRALRLRGQAIRLAASLVARDFFADDGLVRQKVAKGTPTTASVKTTDRVRRASFSISKLRVAMGLKRALGAVRSGAGKGGWGGRKRASTKPNEDTNDGSAVHRWVASESEADAALEEVLSARWEVRCREISVQALLARRRYEAVRVECDHGIALAIAAEDPALGRRLGVLRARAFVAEGDPEHAASALRKVVHTGRTTNTASDPTHASATALLALLLEQGVQLKTANIGGGKSGGRSAKRIGGSGSSAGGSGASMGGSSAGNGSSIAGGSSAHGSASQSKSAAGSGDGASQLTRGTGQKSENTGALSRAQTKLSGSSAGRKQRERGRNRHDDASSVALLNEAQAALVTTLKQHGWGVSLVAGGRPVWRYAPAAALLASVKLRILQARARLRLAAAVGKANVHFLADAHAVDGSSDERGMAIEALSIFGSSVGFAEPTHVAELLLFVVRSRSAMVYEREKDVFAAEAEEAALCGGHGFARGAIAGVPSWLLLRRALSLAVNHSWHEHDLVRRCLLAMSRESIRMREQSTRPSSPPLRPMSGGAGESPSAFRGAAGFGAISIDGGVGANRDVRTKHRAEWNAFVRTSLIGAWRVIQTDRALTRRPGPLELALEADGGGNNGSLRTVPLDTLPTSTSTAMYEASTLAIERAKGNFAAEGDAENDGIGLRPHPLTMTLAGSAAECLMQESTVYTIVTREEKALAAKNGGGGGEDAAADGEEEEEVVMVSMDRVLRHYLTLRKEVSSGFQGLWSASVDSWDDDVSVANTTTCALCFT